MPQIDDVRRRAVLLSEESVGVTTEKKGRKIQVNGQSSPYTTLSEVWLRQLNIFEQGAETLHSLSLGVRPVIVQQPAVIVQPAALIEESDRDTNGVKKPW